MGYDELEAAGLICGTDEWAWKQAEKEISPAGEATPDRAKKNY